MLGTQCSHRRQGESGAAPDPGHPHRKRSYDDPPNFDYPQDACRRCSARRRQLRRSRYRLGRFRIERELYFVCDVAELLLGIVGQLGAYRGASRGSPRGGSARRAAGNPATMTHGPGETLLTGERTKKADASAIAAVPGATVVRAETDSSGASPYEVHMKKADGPM